ncbi:MULTISPECIES: hypothetical protein [unclassified Ruegeria]|uniref:hypothetical protein n=1 Tax=unclassified Ruegeria TaxID=2625375 RepID=UPI00148987F6|nr:MULTISPECIES: hypothetical protein [unclassified Ruegeria]NOG08727.1 hypothetical protein [Ruegeria sp. HKCCD4315]
MRKMLAIPAANGRNGRRKSGLILETILLWPYFVGIHRSDDFSYYQTFSLDEGAELLIKVPLLDRFLACMKPASIT